MNNQQLDLLHYHDGSVTYGITLRNQNRWTPRGWTLHPAEDVSIEQAEDCRRALALKLGFDRKRMIIPQQVHGKAIADIIPDARHPQPIVADAIVTNQPGVLLCISVADCCGVLLWDRDKSIVAAIHAGWRGTAAGIVTDCVEHLVERYRVDPSRLRAWLSPCASATRYVVRSDVAAHFHGYTRPVSQDQYLLDLPSAISSQLISCGVQSTAIEQSGYCTISDERFHSHRRDGTKAGRMASFIGIAE